MKGFKRLLPVLLPLLLVLSAGNALFSQERIYWDDPKTLGFSEPRFPQAASSGRGIVVISHEYESTGDERGNAYVSLAFSPDGATWRTSPRLLGPFPYTGAETPIASLLVQEDGTIYIAVSESQSAIGIYRSLNNGDSFVKTSTATTPLTAIVAPRLYSTGDGLELFVSRDVGTRAVEGGYLGIFYCTSPDGYSWTDFQPLAASDSLRETYLPSLAGNAGKQYVVFQAFKAGGSGGNPPSTYQLYLCESTDGGRSWGAPVLVTGFPETLGLGTESSWEYYDNQRPVLYSDGSRLFLAWERKRARSRLRNVYLAEIDAGGSAQNIVRFESNRDSINPRIAYVRGKHYISWYEGTEQDLSVRLAEGRQIPNVGIDWYYRESSGLDYLSVDTTPDSSAFAVPVAFRNRLYLVWENDEYAGDALENSSVIVRGPDISAPTPRLRGLNFTGGQPASQDRFTVAWSEPRDPSNIAGYSYQFTRSPAGSPPRQVSHFRDETLSASRDLESDGNWYFHIIAQDYAGNWSKPATITIIRDTTPPSPPTFAPPETDSAGFLTSNTATLSWFPPPEEDTAGYTYTYTLLNPYGREVSADTVSAVKPPARVLTRNTEASFVNRDNGTWMLSVASVDEVGNVSPPASLIFRLNKYVPVTIINTVSAERDEVGRTVLTITGRGFTAGGEISRIILDRDGKPPYDYSFSLKDGFYTIAGDRLIRDFAVEDIDQGDYGLGLDHPRRGIKWSSRSLHFEPSGVVKFGDFTYEPASRFTLFAYDHFGISVNALVTILILAGLGIALLITLFMIRGVLAEGAKIQQDVEAIVAGRLLTGPEYRKRIGEMKRKGLGLRIKFVLLVTVLILIVVMMVAVTLGYYMIESRQRTLAEGLQNRAALLLESLAVGARDPIDTNNQESMLSLVSQVEAMSDATGVVITGRSAADPAEQIHAIWAASHPEELIDSLQGEIRIDYRAKDAPEDAPRTFALINADELASYRDRYDVQVTPFYGRSIYTDDLSPAEETLAQQIDEKLSGELSGIETDMQNMQQEQLVLESLNRGLPISAEQRDFIQNRFPGYQDQDQRNSRITQLNSDVVRFNRARSNLIREAGNILNSRPAFDPENFTPVVAEYTFYRPIVGPRQRVDQGDGGTSQAGYFYRGMVRLTVSTESIVQQIINSRQTLITITGIVALIAAVIGIVGALVLATIIIIPINRLVRGVEVIRDTEDKEALESHVIDTRTRDELSGLAQTINEMTRGLVEAARANKDLTLGKEIQKMFLPLDTDQSGRKLTTGVHADQFIDVFGYYEGADALSGDYFDHIDLKNGYRAFIKCDVSGHGAPASLIMVEVATIFTSFFRRLVGKKPNLNVSELVGNINQLLVEREFKGKFAALIVGLLEEKTGKIILCHAGDNLVNIYEESKRKITVLKLPETPAAGVFDQDLIDMRGGYQQVVHQLNHGDTVLFFTDGIEESHHRLRNADFAITSYKDFSEEMREKDQRMVEQGFKEIKPEEPYEEFDPKRVVEVVEAAMHRETYHLERRMDMAIREPLEFDFSGLKGTTEEMVTAMIAVEKVYRLVPDPRATERDRIRVDRKIDEFLKAHFKGYHTYFRNRIEDEQMPEYVWFTHLKEDEQDDDLTILAVRRK